MNCNGFQSELRKAIEQREAAGRADLRAHADVCPRCAPEWERHALLEAVIAGWKGGIPQVDLTDRVMAHWAFDAGAELAERLTSEVGHSVDPPCGPAPVLPAAVATGRRRNRQTIGKWAAVGAAVAALLILLSPLVWRPGTERQDRPQVADMPAPAAPVADSPAQPDVPPLRRDTQTARVDAAVREAGTAWLGLANEATGTVREMAAFLPDRTLASVEQPETDLNAPEPARWTEKLRNGIAPIRRDVGQAMDFLLEAVPLNQNRAI